MVKSLSDSLLGRARLGRVRADRGEVPEWSNGAVSKFYSGHIGLCFRVLNRPEIQLNLKF
jgi:hypothetical protein